jgi:hypothetical protein
MLRSIAGVVLGVVAWFAAVAALGFLAGHAWPALAVASKHPLSLTDPMLGARLGISFISSVIGGLTAALVGGERFRAPLGAGVLLLALFAYYHLAIIWHDFPPWYHLTFLVSLPLLSLVGGRLSRPR